MTPQSDVIIAGAGLVGSVMAAALGRSGLSVTLCDAGSRAQAFAAASDRRAIALAQSSVRVFKHLGVWDALAPQAEPILDIRVVDGFSAACVHYDHREAGGVPLGHIISGGVLKSALLAHAENTPHVTLAFDTKIDAKIADGVWQAAGAHGPRTLAAPLLIAADGKFSAVRRLAGIPERKLAYGQAAIVCVIRHERPHGGLALERFLPPGPFAALPMQEHRSGIVWTEPEGFAAAYRALDAAAFTQEIQRRLDGYLGAIQLDSPTFSYPLCLVMAQRYAGDRVALIGDAAHAIHPIAGQGVNLGYRDVAALAELLVEAKRLGLDLGGAALLARYARWRRPDAAAMIAATDGLNRLFSNDFAPLRRARRLGLAAVEKLRPAKRYFMRHAMGLTGDLPALLREG